MAFWFISCKELPQLHHPIRQPAVVFLPKTFLIFLTPVTYFVNLVFHFVSYLLGLVLVITQLTFTCPKPTMETLEKGVKYAQS